jgi:pyruvate kinase
MGVIRRTKIIATLGPASATPDALANLIAAGVDVFRLNFSHGDHASHAATYRMVREAAAKSGRQIAIMQDLSGPKIRTGPTEGGAALTLTEGDELRIGAGDRAGRPGIVYTPYAPLVESAKPGDRLLLDDGRIELRVVSGGSELTTVVVNGGPLGEKKGINAPGVSLPSSAITPKDADDLLFGIDLGVDFIALSFVQTAADVHRAREVMSSAARQVPLVAKIERPAALANLNEILYAAQGVMVARGDLGLEMPLQQVPRAQKEIIRRARALGRPAIVATQVLESMRVEPRPTRAEVSDAANACGEGADAIMLAGETAVGAYPVRAVQTLDAIIRDAETVGPGERIFPDVDPTGSRHGRALCEAAVTLASAGQADAIVAVTREGKTARLLASLRPSAPIFAVTGREEVARTLTLLWGVTPLVGPDRSIDALEQLLLTRRVMPAGSIVVFVSVSPELTRADMNFLNLQRIG